MYKLTEKIIDRWTAKQPEINDKGFLAICGKFQADNLLEFTKLYQRWSTNEKTCCVCGIKTAYVHGKLRNGKTVWHCVPRLCGNYV